MNRCGCGLAPSQTFCRILYIYVARSWEEPGNEPMCVYVYSLYAVVRVVLVRQRPPSLCCSTWPQSTSPLQISSQNRQASRYTKWLGYDSLVIEEEEYSVARAAPPLADSGGHTSAGSLWQCQDCEEQQLQPVWKVPGGLL